MDHLDMLARLRVEGDGVPAPPDDGARQAYPALWELLTCRTVLDDQNRLPARLSISAGLGCWCVGLYDETLAISIETTCLTLAEAFSALDHAIPDTTKWRTHKRRKPKLKDPGPTNGKPGLHKKKK